MSHTTAVLVRGLVGAAVKGVIGGIQGTAEGIRDGWRKGSRSVAGRPGEAWVKGVNGGIHGAAKGIRDGWKCGQSLPPAAALTFCATPRTWSRKHDHRHRTRFGQQPSIAVEHHHDLHGASFGSDWCRRGIG